MAKESADNKTETIQVSKKQIQLAMAGIVILIVAASLILVLGPQITVQSPNAAPIQDDAQASERVTAVGENVSGIRGSLNEIIDGIH